MQISVEAQSSIQGNIIGEKKSKYLGFLDLSDNIQQPTVLISSLWILNHGLHPSKGLLQSFLCLLSSLFQEIIIILLRGYVSHACALSVCFWFETSQTAPFPSPAQNYLLQNSYRPDYLSIVFPDLVASYMGLSPGEKKQKTRVRIQELSSGKEVTGKWLGMNKC